MKIKIMKNWINTLVFCLVVIFAGFFVYNVTHVLLHMAGVNQRLAETAGRFLACIGILFLYQKLFDIENFGLKNHKFFKGLFTGGFMIVLSFFNLETAISEVAEFPAASPSFVLIVTVILEMAFVGIFEEFLMRGFVLNVLLEKMPDCSFKSKMVAIIISSILFGLIHFLNLFSEPQLVNTTIAQVIYATFIGTYFGVLYLRTHNIWIVVFLHFIYDLVSELPQIFHSIPDGAIGDISVTNMLLTAASSFTFVLAALFLARKFKKEEVLQ